jgi:hypothetical protein
MMRSGIGHVLGLAANAHILALQPPKIEVIEGSGCLLFGPIVLQNAIDRGGEAHFIEMECVEQLPLTRRQPTHHVLPPTLIVSAPPNHGGQSDWLMNVTIVLLLAIVLSVGILYLRLHAIPERMAHRAHLVQFEVVAVLGLLALFTHNNLFWVAALLLALIRIPDFSTPLASMAESLQALAAGGSAPRREPNAEEKAKSQPEGDAEPRPKPDAEREPKAEAPAVSRKKG